MKVELSNAQVQGLIQILNRTQINGSDAEFVVMTRHALNNALSLQVPVEKPVEKPEEKKK